MTGLQLNMTRYFITACMFVLVGCSEDEINPPVIPPEPDVQVNQEPTEPPVVLEEPDPIQRVSVDSSGAQVYSDSSSHSISADGRYVAFASGDSNLVAGDTNNFYDVFVHDTQTGSTTRVSVGSSGTEGNDESDSPSISSDGRYVAFVSWANNLVADDINIHSDIFVHDTQTGSTTRINVDSSGSEAKNGESRQPSISADGRYVAFTSASDNLAANDTNNTYDIFVRDQQSGTTTRVSVDSSGNEANNTGGSGSPSISSGGRYVAFTSRATNLVAGDTNNNQDIFAHDTQTGTTTRVNVDSSGTEGIGGDSFNPAISADGRYVAFASRAYNLVADDLGVLYDIFVHDLQTGTTTQVSVDSSGNQGNDDSLYPSISTGGRYVAYSSFADNLVADDTNGTHDVFVHDTQGGTTSRISVNASGVEGNNTSIGSTISSDGRYVAITSKADNLVAGDTNGNYDVFKAPNQ